MILAKWFGCWAARCLYVCGCLVWGASVSVGQGRLTQDAGRQYGPTSPGGYAVRVVPRSVKMSLPQRPQITVTVENAAGQPVDDVLVTFLPSEGDVSVASSRTRGGVVTGIFSAAAGSDSPRTASLVVTVENIEITVFIDIVPAVFAR